MPDKTVNSELTKVLSGAPAAASAQQTISLVVNGGSDAGEAMPGVSTPATGGQNTWADALTQNTAQLTQVRSSLQGQLDTLTENTRALIENTTSNSSGLGSAVANTAGSLANDLLGGGLLGPVVSGLMNLFGGGGENEAPAPLMKFALPPSVQFSAGMQGQAIGAVDYGQNDTPRAVQATAAPTPPQVTVNVSAMDSRSFLDHSSEIANAVRRAMLESSSLNDVIGEM